MKLPGFSECEYKVDKNTEDNIAITAILHRFTEQRLPRVLSIEKKLLAGEKISEVDLEFLELVIKDAERVLKLADNHPEYQNIFLKALQLYSDVTKDALKNENQIETTEKNDNNHKL